MSITVNKTQDYIQLTTIKKGHFFKFKFSYEYTVAEAIEEFKTHIL